MAKPQRVCVYPKDIAILTGKTERYCRDELKAIRAILGKQPHQYITDEEYARYAGIKIEIIREVLNR